MGVAVEVAVDTLEGALIAERAGASRIELCASLTEGGITPGPGTIETVVAQLSVPVAVMIRPRSGSFVYSSGEVEIMRTDIRRAKEAGAGCAVIGALLTDGEIDVETVGRLVAEARPMEVTFHRAIDATPDPVLAIAALISLGVDRVLTSGGAITAEEGLSAIRSMVRYAGEKGKLAIMPGSGVRERNAAAIVRATGTTEIHLSARLPAGAAPTQSTAHHQALGFGSNPPLPDGQAIRAVVQALDQISSA